MDRIALSSVLLVMAVAGCPGPAGIKPLPEGPPPEYEKPRTYDPEGKNIDGQPLGTEEMPDAPPPAPAPAPTLPEEDAPPPPEAPPAPTEAPEPPPPATPETPETPSAPAPEPQP